MDSRRLPLILLAVVVVLGIALLIGSSGQRNAWLEGYIAGSTAGGEGGTIAPYALAYGGRGFGFHPAGLLCIPGLLFFFVPLALFLIAGFWRRSMGGPGWGQPRQWHGGCGRQTSQQQPGSPQTQQPIPAEPVEATVEPAGP